MIAQQLTFNFKLNESATFENFYAGATNTLPLQNIKMALADNNPALIYLWGKTGVGCSHVLQAACHFATTNKQTAMYFSLQQLLHDNIHPNVFTDLENIDVLCCDDVDVIAGQTAWEEAIFHLYNRMQASKGKFLFAAKHPPTQLAIKLPDLQSRLAAAIVWQVQALTDQEKISALQLRAQSKGLQLVDNVAEFLIQRVSRDMHSLMNYLKQLEEQSLIEQRKVTVPFVKHVLAI